MWQAEQSYQCSGCGMDVRETTDPESGGGPGRLARYKAHLVTCHACAAQEQAARGLANESAGEVFGARWRIEQRR